MLTEENKEQQGIVHVINKSPIKEASKNQHGEESRKQSTKEWVTNSFKCQPQQSSEPVSVEIPAHEEESVHAKGS